MTNSDFHRSAGSGDLQTLLEVRDFLQDISTGADVTDASRDSATEFVALLDAEYAEKWEGSDGEPSNGKQPLMASRPAPPVPSDQSPAPPPDSIRIELDSCRSAVATIEANRTWSTTQNRNYAFYQGKVAGLEFALAAAPVTGTPAQGCGMREARLANNSNDWTEIFPSQLEWVAKAGHQVRAIEVAAQPPAAPVQTDEYAGAHEIYCNASRKLPVGCEACSCRAGREIKKLRALQCSSAGNGDLNELDRVIGIFGRATTETYQDPSDRYDAIKFVRDYLFELRERLTATEPQGAGK